MRRYAAVGAAAIACLIVLQAPSLSQPTAPPAQNLAVWRQVMARTPLPKKGCFRAFHPSPNWVEVPCVTAPPVPFLSPKAATAVSGAALSNGLIVGNGDDFSAVVSGTMTSAVGSFPTITGVTSESSNSYSLQLNTNLFTTPACSGALVPADCRGWQQFIYSTSGSIFLQYWLINFANSCPAGYTAFDAHCFRNSAATSASDQPIMNLANLSVTGTVSSTTDTIIFSTGSGALCATGQDSVLSLQGKWNVAEFNVFGDGNGTQANFNNGSTIVVQIGVTNGTTASPACTNDGFTGETSNLNLVQGSCCPTGGTSPAIQFTETNATGVKAPSCLLHDLIPIVGPLL